MSELTIELDEDHLRLQEEAATAQGTTKAAVVASLLETLPTASSEPESVKRTDGLSNMTIQEWVMGAPHDLASNPKYIKGLGK